MVIDQCEFGKDRAVRRQMVAHAEFVASLSEAFSGGGPTSRQVSKPKTRNPNPETRNPKPEILIPKSETRKSETETRNPKPETRTPKPETRNLPGVSRGAVRASPRRRGRDCFPPPYHLGWFAPSPFRRCVGAIVCHYGSKPCCFVPGILKMDATPKPDKDASTPNPKL